MKPVDILVVDDSPADRASIRIAFEAARMPIRLHFATGGRMALDLLRRSSDPSKGVRPHMCIVDLKMPDLSGLDVLRTIKSDADLQDLPVIVYSGSDDPADVRAAYSAFASGYIRKPPDVRGLNEVADVLGRLCTSLYVFPEK